MTAFRTAVNQIHKAHRSDAIQLSELMPMVRTCGSCVLCSLVPACLLACLFFCRTSLSRMGFFPPDATNAYLVLPCQRLQLKDKGLGLTEADVRDRLSVMQQANQVYVSDDTVFMV